MTSKMSMVAILFLFCLFEGCGDESMAGWVDKSPKAMAALTKARDAVRAYEGAPPVIPHEVEELGRRNCLSCHEYGNALNTETGKFAPITPHPEQLNCKQCHVAVQTGDLFKTTSFKAMRLEKRTEKLNPLGPPYIPHRVHDRSNCGICHLSESTDPLLVPDHGYRSNCLQCHVKLQESYPVFPSD